MDKNAMDRNLLEELIAAAAAQRRFSHAPYSGYRVGAALLAKNGRIYTGCNIENAAFTPSVCAERTAYIKAVSEGVHDFEAICIVGGREDVPASYSMPCGVCLQTMMEFCDPGSFRIIVARDPDTFEIFTLRELLPKGFGPASLG